MRPGKLGLGVGVGVFVGVSPFWGLHLGLAVLLATIFRLNRVLVYAAANVASLPAPLVIFLEFQLGHRLLRGEWMDLSLGQVASLRGVIQAESVVESLLSLSADFVVGGLVFGVIVGAVAGVATWLVSRIGRHPEAYETLVDRVALRYLDVSIRDAEAARRALLVNPAYPFLLAEPSFAQARQVLDLGCGRGLAAALAAELPEPEGGRTYVGVDRSERYVRAGREALAGESGVSFVTADLRDFDPPPADLVLVFNTLRYLPPAAQDALLRRLGKALSPGARVLVRGIDADAGWRASVAVFRDGFGLWLPGRTRLGIHARRLSDVRNALVAAGFEVKDRSTFHGASRARFLLEAIRRPKSA